MQRCPETPVNGVPGHHTVGLTGFEPATLTPAHHGQDVLALARVGRRTAFQQVRAPPPLDHLGWVWMILAAVYWEFPRGRSNPLASPPPCHQTLLATTATPPIDLQDTRRPNEMRRTRRTRRAPRLALETAHGHDAPAPSQRMNQRSILPMSSGWPTPSAAAIAAYHPE
jgi:hypothetical protein